VGEKFPFSKTLVFTWEEKHCAIERARAKRMTAPRRREQRDASTTTTATTLVQPTKISDLRPGWIGDAYFRALVEVNSSADEKEESSTTTAVKQQQKEFLVGDASAKITFRCSDKREGLFFCRVLLSFSRSSSLSLSVYISLSLLIHVPIDLIFVQFFISTLLLTRVSTHTFPPHNHTNTAETLKPNEIYHLKSGKIEMIRGQMRLMTDRKTNDKSAVAPVARHGEVSLLPPEADVPKAKDCGAMDLSVLFFERIQ
jgi:hypothetical protein